MKRIAFTLIAVLFSVSMIFAVKPTPPTKGDPIKKSTYLQDDLNQFEQEFEGLQSLENLVSENGLTVEELKASDNNLINFLDEDISIENSIMSIAAPGDGRLLGIGGFIWGFCLGLLGIILVYVLIDDPQLRRKEGGQAIIGCLVAGVVSAAIQLLLIGAQ